jgi:hypothetical protein
MEENYEITEEQCLRRNELPRLIQRSLNSCVSHDSTLDNILSKEPKKIEEPKESKIKYLTKPKKSLIDFQRRLNTLRSRTNLISKKREALRKDYQGKPELRSLVLLNICNSCEQNSLCINYQDYQRIIEEYDALVND